MTAVISACILKKLIKIGEFLHSHFNIEDGRKKQHFWHIMLSYFQKGKNTTETLKKIGAVYGEGTVTDRTCQKWFAKFHAGDFSLDDAPGSGRPVEVDSDQIEILTENNQRCTTEEIANILKISKPRVENHLHQLGYVNHFGVWVPHELSEKYLLDCTSACDSLLKRKENVPFFCFFFNIYLVILTVQGS